MRSEIPWVLDLSILSFSIGGVEVLAGYGAQGWFVRSTAGLGAPWNPLRHELRNFGLELLVNQEGAFGLGLSFRAN